MAHEYARPPITEAVVEFRLFAPLENDLIRKIGQAFDAHYPRSEEIQEIEVQLGPAGALTRRSGFIGVKRTNFDANEIVTIKPESLNIAQLAPYPRWDVFIERVKRDWKIWRGKTDYRDLSRIGVRFINRIDIPRHEGGEEFVPKDYLVAAPAIPQAFASVKGYQMNVLVRSDELNSDITLNTGTVESPLLKHNSLLLDIDIGRVDELPKREDGIFSFLDAVRDEKNRLFEACLTDRARELF